METMGAEKSGQLDAWREEMIRLEGTREHSRGTSVSSGAYHGQKWTLGEETYLEEIGCT